MATIETIINNALEVVGHPRLIGNILEGSTTSQAALDAWGLTRDALLYELEPDWAAKDAPLTLLKSAPNITGAHANYPDGVWDDSYPVLPWLYEYAVPDDAIKPLQVKTAPFLLPRWRPRYIPFRNLAQPSGDVVLTDAPGAILAYTCRLTDPERWANDFTDAMILRLAKTLGPVLGKAPQKEARDGGADRAG